jgi:hypothetical protein
MTPQLLYALRKVVIQIVLAALAVVAAEQTNLLAAAGLDPLIWGAIVASIVAAITRTFEGFRDGQRAAGDTANMQESDVGFRQVKTKAEVAGTSHLVAVVTDPVGDKLDVHVVRDNGVPSVDHYPDPVRTPYSETGDNSVAYPEPKPKTPVIL